ncbi:MAG: GntR family transcriptional regulator [Glaciihabitans sp.]|nr:GntR family transcriptional regulator [Glaciihabitans sp.]
MLIRVDPTSAIPLFEQLAAGVRSEVIRGALRAGEKLPSARELAASLDINVHTVLHAYQNLRDEGLIDLRRGRGAIVTDHAEGYLALAASLPALVAEAKTLNLSPIALAALIREAY